MAAWQATVKRCHVLMTPRGHTCMKPAIGMLAGINILAMPPKKALHDVDHSVQKFRQTSIQTYACPKTLSEFVGSRITTMSQLTSQYRNSSFCCRRSLTFITHGGSFPISGVMADLVASARVFGWCFSWFCGSDVSAET